MTLQKNSSSNHSDTDYPEGGTASHRQSAGKPTEIVTVRPDAETLTRQRLPYFIGISETTAGAKGISMNLVIIPPGGSAEPHLHRDYETAIYLIKGRVETRYGQGLKQTVINEAGDFIFIPPGVPHQPHNLSDTEPAHALVARNDSNEQENVVLYNPVSER
ncbi:cupin domain-containing protein [Leptolyngbya sp. GB1-A1]|uniref:cupin domain-containing protein n=1 Tax=Leptolyngbya sp. GB1-A1 TaxID=2933908 RepID=UPI003297365D